jgi:hypothetical protein
MNHRKAQFADAAEDSQRADENSRSLPKLRIASAKAWVYIASVQLLIRRLA